MSSVRRSSSSGGRAEPSATSGLFGAGPSGGPASVMNHTPPYSTQATEAQNKSDDNQNQRHVDTQHPRELRKLGIHLSVEQRDPAFQPSDGLSKFATSSAAFFASSSPAPALIKAA